VTSAVEPSLYVAVALNCCVEPTETLAVVGDTAIDFTVLVGIATVRVAVSLTPLSRAFTVVEPEASAVARPLGFTVATAASAIVQVAVELMLAVEPSLYFPVAVNCCVPPIARLVLDGDTASDVSVFVGGGSLEALDGSPRQPALTIRSESERKQAGIGKRQ
jgi:hypothetical protein